MTKSLLGKIWQQKKVDENYIQELIRSLGISDFLARIISTRTVNIEEAFNFLSPKLKNLMPDPFHLLDMEKAVKRTIKAILNKEKVGILADYDVDGATSAALLKTVFREIGINVEVYVPDRILEGYGPNKQAMQNFKKDDFKLIITLDCGASAHDALKYAKELELDVIVIDHHMSLDELPESYAVINPNRLDEATPLKYLAAVGVTFFFAVALISELKKNNYFASNSAPDLMSYLDLVALGTVCDVMSITHLNRAFVAQGLKIMHQRQNIGIKTLFDMAQIEEKPTCYHLGFILGPRINAGGRVGKSHLGAKLLSTLCNIEACKLAGELEKHNNERKVLELMMYEEAVKIASTQEDDKSLFIVGKGWHVGVIGIIAGRLKEKFNKPVAVIALDDGIGKASCRSIKNIDFGSKIIEAKNRGLLVAGGGHSMAAGFTVMEDKIEELKNFLNNLFIKDFQKLINFGIEEYDLEITTNGINSVLIEEIHKLEPFGNGNPEPIFKFSKLFVLKAQLVADKHIKCLLAPSRDTYSSKAISAIAFNARGGEMEKILLNKIPYTIAVIGSLKKNNWQGQQYIQVQIKDIIVDEKNITAYQKF